MKFSTTLVAAVLSASTIMAAPGTAHRRARQNKRSGATRASKPMIPMTNVTATVNGIENLQTEYSTNWAGAALVGTGYTGVTGTFTIPSISLPSGGSSRTSYYASAWVGLDGYTCETAILQTGIDFNLENGVVSYDSWYEWYPDYAYTFSGITFSEGDVVTLTIKATSKTAGTATVENVTTGTTVTHTFSGESDSLCETNAEWIVEDFVEVTGNTETQVPFVDFGTVTFTDAYATTSSGTVGVTDAEIVEMVDSTGSTIIVDASVSGSETVVITYVD